MQQIYLILNGHQTGPFSAEQCDGMIKSGIVTLKTRAWAAGLSEWQSLATVLPRGTGNPPPIPDNANVHGTVARRALKLFLPDGRIGRGIYFLLGMGAWIAFGIICLVLSPIDSIETPTAQTISRILVVLLFLGWLYFELVLAAKRFHDLNLTGWLAPLCCIPLVPLFLLILSGTPGPNKYGPGSG